MTAAAASRAPGGAYEGAGRQLAPSLRAFSSILVVSDDPVAAAHTAIGIGLAESSQRLVMIGDLAGEVAPLQALARDDDAHGIYDSFEFGTSFVRIAREVEGAPNLFIMPSGTESAAIERIIASPRWQHFASDFAKADELLLLVAQADAPGLALLAAQLDGVVLVGIRNLQAASDISVVARVPHPVVAPPPKIDLAPKRASWSPGKVGFAAATLLALGIAGGALFAVRAGSGDSDARPLAKTDTAVVAPVVPPPPAILPENPHDSAVALAWGVEILAANTAEGANFEINRHGSQMPAATISLVPIGDTEATWYKVHAGAFADSAEAIALLAALRRRGVVSDSAGSVVRSPFALLVDTIPAQAGMRSRVREKVRELTARGIHAYGLLQRDGSARLYAGAFDRPQQSSLAATALRVAGITPVLEYRVGRLP